ncbi:hypothetical protein RHMOL_Rhmol10G0217000 [Rhododendron molle]|uniref:Uncharacterized protein n=1 Tax=Rhododendron molle TaxID=49168 RepID=A0ACC0M4R4_RHOML|nr:hypothetical protein RHMOL_Rhmol10G0217000 [Rhododendron molle]
MLRAFPQVLMMDCTYKTNKYRFPLLQIVGVTSTEMTFCAAFAFMECEKTENYTWVLEKLKGMMDPNALPSVIVTDRELALMNAITNVFPHATNLLCRWHIGKNVLAKCRKMFDDKMWEEFICSWGLVVLSASVAQYEERLCVLKRDFQMVPAALEYVEKNCYEQLFYWEKGKGEYGGKDDETIRCHVASHPKSVCLWACRLV